MRIKNVFPTSTWNGRNGGKFAMSREVFEGLKTRRHSIKQKQLANEGHKKHYGIDITPTVRKFSWQDE